MNTLLDLTAPLIVTAACVLALCKGVDIFAAMTDGAKKGLRVMADILPALLVLFPVIYLLRASGLPELLERLQDRKHARSAHSAAGIAQRLSLTPAAVKYTAMTYSVVSLEPIITAAVRPTSESAP